MSNVRNLICLVLLLALICVPAPCANASGSNDNPDGATVFPPNSSGTGTVDYDEDPVDWWVVTVSALGDLRFTLEVPSGEDFDLKVYNSYLGLLGSSAEGSGIDEEVKVSMTYSGPYYAKVYTYGSSAGAYTIRNEIISPDPPAPDIEDLDYPSSITLGEWAEIEFSVDDDANGDVDEGYISISFPSLNSDGDKAYVQNNGSSSDLQYYEKDRYDNIYHKDNGLIQASYLLAEGYDDSWSSGEKNYLKIRVQPQEAGTFYFYIRGQLINDSTVYTDPSSSGYKDQQGWPVERYQITVNAVNDPPTVSITSGPSGPIGDDDVTFSWSGSDSDGYIAGYEVMMDGTGWSTANTSMTFNNLSESDHTFKVRALDNDGDYSNWVTRTFTIDLNDPPTVSIIFGPSGPIGDDDVTFSWSGSDSDGFITGYEVMMDGTGWSTANTSMTFNNLSEGDHTFKVRALDNDGDYSNWVTRTFTIDLNDPPTVSITSGPSGPIDDDDVTFSWSGSDSDGYIAGYEVMMDGTGWSTANTSMTFNNLSESDHTFKVRALDNDGDYSNWVTRTFTIDLNDPPTVSIIFGPSGPIGDDDVTFSWSGSDSDGFITGYEVMMDGTGWSTANTSMTFNNLSESDHTFKVRALDNDGDYSNWVTRTFTIDLPRVLIIQDTIPDPLNPTEWIEFQDFLDTDEVNYISCTETQFNNGNVDMQQIDCIVLTNSSLQRITQSLVVDRNMLIYEDQADVIHIPGQDIRFDPVDNSLSVPKLPPNGATTQPVPVGYYFDPDQFWNNAGMTLIGQLDPTPTTTLVTSTKDFADGEYVWGAWGLVSGTVGTGAKDLFFLSLPACAVTFEAAGGACWLTAGSGTVWAVTMIPGLFRDTVRLGEVKTSDGSIAYDLQLHRLQSAGGTIDCSAYYVPDSDLGYAVLRSDSPSICKYVTPLDASLGHFTFDNDYLYNSGVLSGPMTGGTFSENTDYRIDSAGQIDLDIRDDTFEYTGTNGSHTFNFTSSGGFDQDIVWADWLYPTGSVDADFALSSDGILSKILTVTPTYPDTTTVGSTITLEVEVGLEVGEGGILQVLVMGDKGTNEVDYVFVNGGQSVLVPLSVDIQHSSPMSETFSLYVQFRPGTTTGPLNTSDLSDIIEMPEPFSISWVQTGTVSVNVTPNTASWTISGPSGFTGNEQTYTNDQTFLNAPVGSYTWTGQPLNGYNTPSSETKTLSSGGTVSFNKTWTMQTGSLHVLIGPQEAIEAGAQWRRVGTSTWRNSGYTESGISVGSYTVEFKTVSDWNTPTNQSVTINNEQTTSTNGIYTAVQVDCEYNISPTLGNFRAIGESKSVSVDASRSDCPWTTSESLSWVSLSPTSGTGYGAVTVTVSENTGAARSGNVTIAGETYSIIQAEADCSYSISPTSGSFPSSGGSETVSVDASRSDCLWSTSENLNWVSLSPSSGTGDGMVTVIVYTNTGPARNGTVTIAGKTYSISQLAGSGTDLEILSSYNGPDSGALRGLSWDGSTLWSNTSPDGRSSTIYEHSMNSSLSVSTTYPSPSSYTCGIEWIDGRLWSVDNMSDRLVKHTSGITSIDSIYTLNGRGSPVGVAWTGSNIIVTNEGYLQKFTADGNFISETYVQSFSDLTYLGGYILGSQGNKIYLVDSSFSVVRTYTTSLTSISGIAWDGTYLWLADSGTNKIYKTEIVACSAPSSPSGVSASDGTYTDKVRITWDSVSGAAIYQVYRATSSDGVKTLIGSPTSTSFEDTSASGHTTYYYWVKAVNSCGESEYSSYDTGYQRCYVPLEPSGVSASDGTYTDKVRITWDSVSGADSYKVYRATSFSGEKTLIGSPTSTSFDDTSASAGTTYYYWVKAVNSCGESQYSSYNTGYRGLCAVPTAPSGVSASDGTYTNKVMVTWDSVSGADSYKVYRATSPNGAKTHIGSMGTSTYYNDYSASVGTTYYYWVKAVNSCGESQYSADDTGYRACDVPPTPSGVSASDGTYTDKVRITWDPVSGADSYKVYRATSSGGVKTLIGSPTSTSFDDTSASIGTTYYYWVKAVNSCGESQYSSYDTGYRVAVESKDMSWLMLLLED